jgi:phospholipid transport system substrate-binding protein
MPKIITTLMLVLGLFSSNSYAEPQRTKAPDALLKEGIYHTVDFLRREGATDLGNILDFVDEEVAQYFDFEGMTAMATGRAGRELSQKEFDRLVYKIRSQFINTLSRNLVDYAYTNKEIRFFPPRRSQFGRKVEVSAIVTHPRSFATRISFKFHKVGNDWKIYDVAANGQSAVIFYRRMIRKVIRRNGLRALAY